MTVDLQPTDYAVTLAAWRERNKGFKWDGAVCDEQPSLSYMRGVVFANTYMDDLLQNPRLTRALYAAIQAEGRR